MKEWFRIRRRRGSAMVFMAGRFYVLYLLERLGKLCLGWVGM